MKNSGRHVSMDAPLIEGEDSNLYDVLDYGESPNPDRALLHESLQVEILRALETLTPREADVVKLYFGLENQHPMTLEEIGETFDLTRERVRQIKEKAIRRLKHTSRSKILKTYLG
jgi:RNA polymerase primary sigma factor